MKDQVTHFENSIGKAKNMLKRTQPLRIMMSHTRKRNLWLQSERRILQRQVKELKEYMELMKTKSEKKYLERGTMEETIETGQEETTGK